MADEPTPREAGDYGTAMKLTTVEGSVPDAQPCPPSAARSPGCYERIDGHRIKEKDFEVVGISLKSRDAGDKYWKRIAEQQYDLPPQWFALDWNVTATANGKTLTFKSLNPSIGSVPTPSEGREAEAVWVGTGSAADFIRTMGSTVGPNFFVVTVHCWRACEDGGFLLSANRRAGLGSAISRGAAFSVPVTTLNAAHVTFSPFSCRPAAIQP